MSNNAYHVKQIHTHVVKMGFLGDPFMYNGFLGSYCKKLKDLVSMCKLFDEMLDKVVVCCWTLLISGYAQSSQTEDVLQFFLMMV